MPKRKNWMRQIHGTDASKVARKPPGKTQQNRMRQVLANVTKKKKP